MPPKWRPNRFEPQAISVPAAMATSPAGMPPYFTPPNQLTRMMAKQTTPIIGVMNISSAGRMEMKVIDTPASVPSRAARGVILRMIGREEAADHQDEALEEDPDEPGLQPLIGSPVASVIGSMITKVTMNMCGTLMPDGSAQTSARPVFSARR